MTKLLGLLSLIEYGNHYHFTENVLLEKIAIYISRIIKALAKDCDNAIFVVDDSVIQVFSQLQHKSKKTTPIDFVSHNIKNIQAIFSNKAVQNRLENEQFYSQHRIKKNYDFHHKACEKIFLDIEKSEQPFWVQIDHFDGDQLDIYDGEGRYSTGFIRLSVLSEKALEYDYFAFQILSRAVDVSSDLRKLIKEIYRPYFIEYYIESSQLTRRQKEELNSTILSDSGWFNARFVSIEDNRAERTRQFDGVFSYSASPVIYKKRRLEIIDKVRGYNSRLSPVYTPINASPDKEIEQELKAIFKDTVLNKVKIYKIGNGNCVYSYGTNAKNKEAKRLLYDIGFDNSSAVRACIHSMKVPYQPSIDSIRKLVPSCIILSHWDADHYKACAYAGNAIYDCRWIAPTLDNSTKGTSTNAKRLAQYLFHINKLMLVQRTTQRKISIDLTGYSTLTLLIGKTVKGLSPENCRGIAIKYENHHPCVATNEIRCLMQGDVPYTALLPMEVISSETPYEYLIVPHHGSKMDLIPCPSMQDGVAVICCTNQPTDGRPQCCHLKWLNDHYSNVVTTEEAPSIYIQLNLRQKNSVIMK